MSLDAPSNEQADPPHNGDPIPFPTDYRQARIALGRTYATNGYALFRRHLDAWTLRALEQRERPVLAASEPIATRKEPLTEEHSQFMREIFELMHVPGAQQTGLSERVRSQVR